MAMREQDLLKRLGQQIRAYRRETGLTLEKLADKIGVSYRTIADIERGLQFTSLANLYQIAKAVNRELPDLFAWAGNRKASERDGDAKHSERAASHTPAANRPRKARARKAG